eukprot:TRINITY_DN92668_c0_g1_i1.p1 TRINITY_DN92668_c0_g1~~TRINITY_DN92668_c0_g1_i1.p1  ORF type:complete len:436 (+),score=81.31 TRINITY_DN92668_c0_g1_i1:65-1372(+)
MAFHGADAAFVALPLTIDVRDQLSQPVRSTVLGTGSQPSSLPPGIASADGLPLRAAAAGALAALTAHSSLSRRCAGRRQGRLGQRSRTLAKATSVATTTSSPAAGKKIGVVTGAASIGIGRKTVEGMIRSGQYSHIVLAGRNAEKHEVSMDAIREATASGDGSDTELLFLELELDSLSSVRACVEEFNKLELPADAPLVLVLNAGVMALPDRQLTQDGFEYQMGVNHCGHFALTNLLLPELVRRGSAEEPSRIISVASSAHTFGTDLAKGDLQDVMFESDPSQYSAWRAYGNSKMANVLMTYELHKRLSAAKLPVLANVLHPGVVKTELGRYIFDVESLPDWGKSLVEGSIGNLLKTPEQGAATSVLLATAPAKEVGSGRYWQDEERTPSLTPSLFSSGSSYEEAVWRKFWDLSESWTGVRYPQDKVALDKMVSS